MGEIGIRRATPEEAPALTDLALRSKASWGYDEDFVERCRETLTITDDEIHRYPVFVATDEDAIVGYYAMALESPECYLVALFVSPERARQGIGFRLFAHASATARAVGCEGMTVESDPNAEGFYERMGARRIGEVESEVEPGRTLPLLRADLR